MHDRKIAIADTNDNDGNGKPVARDNQVNCLLSVMNLAVCQNEQNHVLVVRFLEVFAFADSLFQELCKICWPAELCVFEDFSVLSDNLVDSIKVRVVNSAIDWETMVDFSGSIKIWMVDSGTKPINRHQFIIIVVHQDVSHLSQRLFINTFSFIIAVVKTVFACSLTVAASKINTGYQG